MSNPKKTQQKIPRLNRDSDTLTSAERWQAIVKRDATINTFVYAVLTTKIYCRPSCPARLARRANVQFYDTPSQAEGAGFRPCKRCKPQVAPTAGQSNPQTAMVAKACETIRGQLAAGLKPRLGDLAAQAGLTASHFHRVFKKRMGVTPGQYAAGVVQGSDDAHFLSGPSTTETFPELETACSDVDGSEGLALSVAGLSAGYEGPGVVDNGWNEFDVLLAAEQGSLEPLSIDPRVISMA